MPIETISFRNQLIEAMHGFLAHFSPEVLEYSEFFSELIVALSGHREEGVSLYPAVFVCDQMQAITDALGGVSPILIGEGPVNRETVQRVLKQCSPLSERRQWAVFIVLAEQARFGVFRTERSILDQTILSTLRSMVREDIFLVGLTQLGANVVEVRGANGYGLQFYLSGAQIDAKQPTEVIEAFVNAVSVDADEDVRQPLRSFYTRVAAELIRGLHGSLIAVVPKSESKIEIFTDAIILQEPVLIPAAIRACLLNPGAEESSLIFAQSNLIRGMLSCDGITLFRSDGALIGYNAFVQPTTLSRPGIGGARRRAFSTLSDHIGKGISLAVIRSQDGSVDYTSSSDI